MENFDSIARGYDGIFAPHVRDHYLNKRFWFIRRNFPSCKKVLDAGCGTGLLLQKLWAAGLEVCGVDASKEMMGIAGGRVPGRVLVSDITSMPFPEKSFDLVLCVATLHHLGNKVSGAIREMVRVTRVGGHILLWDHNPFNPYWYFLLRKAPQDRGNEKLVAMRVLAKELKENGIRIRKMLRCGFVPDFAPRWMMPVFLFLEKGLQNLPVCNLFLAHNVVVGEKVNVEK